MELVREAGDPSGARLLTIVVPSYRHEAYVEECLRSIDNAELASRIDLIVIDDGSPDTTLERAVAFRFRDALTLRIYSKPNSGLVDSLARGLALASTPYVAFMASDDFYSTPGLDRVLALLASKPRREICWVCQAMYLDGRDGELVYGSHLARIGDLPADARLRALSIEHPKPLLLQSTVFSTEMLRSVGPWSGVEELDDWPTFIRVAEMATTEDVDFRYWPDLLLTRYRQHGGGVHNDTSRQLRLCLQVVNNVVRPEFRSEATAHVYSDLSLVFLYQRKFLSALRLYWHALLTRPTPATALRGPIRVIRSILKRLSGTFEHGSAAQ